MSADIEQELTIALKAVANKAIPTSRSIPPLLLGGPRTVRQSFRRPPWQTSRWFLPSVIAAVIVTLVLAAAVSVHLATEPPAATTNTPVVANGCIKDLGPLGTPHSLANSRAGSGSRLVPSDTPIAGLLCEYAAVGPPGTGIPAEQVLAGGKRLNRAQAAQLAASIAQVAIVTMAGETSCPSMEAGAGNLIAFSYASGPDISLWYSPTGCQTLSNGKIHTTIGGNPSWAPFQTSFGHLR